MALQLITLLLAEPTDDSVEVACGFVTECGACLAELTPQVIRLSAPFLHTCLHTFFHTSHPRAHAAGTQRHLRKAEGRAARGTDRQVLTLILILTPNS